MDEPPPIVRKRCEYKAVVTITRVELNADGGYTDADPETLVINGTAVQADTFPEAMPKIETALNEQWLQVTKFANVVEDDLDTNKKENT